MKKSTIRKIGILSSLIFVLPLLSACDTVFAPKDPNAQRSSARSTSATSTYNLSDAEKEKLDDYEKVKKADAHRNLGNAYLQNGRHNMALAEFKSALQLTPGNYDLMYDIGLVYLLWNNPEDAIVYFEDVLAIRPDHAPAINSMGNAYLALKDYDQAILYYQKINDGMVYGTPYMPMANMGLAYFNKGDYAKAEECYKAALKMEPNYVNALVLLGQLQIETGNTQEALKNLQKAARLESSAPVVQYYLGQAYAKSGDRVQAATAFENALKTAPAESEVYERSADELRKLHMPVQAQVEATE